MTNIHILENIVFLVKIFIIVYYSKQLLANVKRAIFSSIGKMAFLLKKIQLIQLSFVYVEKVINCTTFLQFYCVFLYFFKIYRALTQE